MKCSDWRILFRSFDRVNIGETRFISDGLLPLFSTVQSDCDLYVAGLGVHYRLHIILIDSLKKVQVSAIDASEKITKDLVGLLGDM